MRLFLCGLALAALAAITSGSASATHTQPAPSSNQPAAKAGDTKTCVMQSAGHDVLRLTVPADTKCTPTDAMLEIVSHDRYVELWLVRGARTVDEAVGRVPQVITSEFNDFKVTATTNLTIGGAPAKRLQSPGKEADDGDPGQADVIVFMLGPHIFIACTHGESLSAASQKWMLEVVQAAKAP